MREIGSLGVALDRQGKTDDAIAEFKKAIDVHFVGPLLRVLLSSLRSAKSCIIAIAFATVSKIATTTSWDLPRLASRRANW
jgi:hypothetical protein